MNPIELSKHVESIVIDGDRRKYNIFRLEPFYGQIATARGVGCNLGCNFCWINPSKDEPKKYGEFYSPQEVYDKLIEVSSNEYGRAIMTEGIRISGCEPTLGRNHLLSLIELTYKEKDFKYFLLETNGMLLGHDSSYIDDLSNYKEKLVVRVSIKAGNPQNFKSKTLADKEFYHLPFDVLRMLKEKNIDYYIAVSALNPVLTSPTERKDLFIDLISTEGSLKGLLEKLEEEKIDLFEITKRRLTRSTGITNFDGFRSTQYEPILSSLINHLKKSNKSTTVEDVLSLKNYEILNLLNDIDFKTIGSECNSCTTKTPWHGHSCEDDLDSKLT